MLSRTRHAHIRTTDAKGREWKLTWSPATGELYGRPLHSRTQYAISGQVLLKALAEGRTSRTAPKEDPRQLRFA